MATRRRLMEVTYPHCSGLDIHKRRVVACVLVSGAGGKLVKEIRTFGTLTDELQALGDWLAGYGVSHVAMEATGVYWKNHEGRALTGTG